MIDKLKTLIQTQQGQLSEQHKQSTVFQIKLEGALEFIENVLKPFVQEAESESNTVSEEIPETK